MQNGEKSVRVVLDTNTVVSVLLWFGPPRRVLDAARGGLIELSTSPALLAELDDVLQRPKFAGRLDEANVAPEERVLGYAVLGRLLHPSPIPPVILSDPDDDEVLACAASGKADRIVSGDTDLLHLGSFAGIPIVTAAQLISELFPSA